MSDGEIELPAQRGDVSPELRLGVASRFCLRYRTLRAAERGTSFVGDALRDCREVSPEGCVGQPQVRGEAARADGTIAAASQDGEGIVDLRDGR